MEETSRNYKEEKFLPLDCRLSKVIAEKNKNKFIKVFLADGFEHSSFL